nr:hypothetical protein [Tanacetum cinerariifolium]GEV75390.1 hypothetical protein [Tanacetum cinerariifolium]
MLNYSTLYCRCLHQLSTNLLPNLPLKKLLIFIKTLGYDEDTKQKMFVAPHLVATRLHKPWIAILSVLNRFILGKTQVGIELDFCFTKLIIDHFLSTNKSIPLRSDVEMHSEGQDSPLSKLINTVDVKFKFGIGIPDIMINDAIKLTTRYKYYKLKKDLNIDEDNDTDDVEDSNMDIFDNASDKGDDDAA